MSLQHRNYCRPRLKHCNIRSQSRSSRRPWSLDWLQSFVVISNTVILVFLSFNAAVLAVVVAALLVAAREPPEHSADELAAAGVTVPDPESVLVASVGAAIVELKLLLAPMAA